MRTVGPPLVFGVVFLGAWELIVAAFDIAPFTLPAPSAIWSAFTDRFDQVLDETLITGTNALVGFLCGIVLGVLVSLLTVRFRASSRCSHRSRSRSTRYRSS